MKRIYKDTCLIKLTVGDKVQEIGSRGRIGVIMSITLTPNGRAYPELVCVLEVKLDNGNSIRACSENFKPVDNLEYEES